MAEELTGRRVAFVATDGVEQVELTQPWPELVSLDGGTIQGFDHLDRADTFPVDHRVGDVSAAPYDAPVLPGGVANADALRADPGAVAFTRSFFAHGKPVAVICHGPWLLAEADVVRGRRPTSWPSLRTDLRNAGAEWVDESGDLDGFCAAAIELFAAQPAGTR